MNKRKTHQTYQTSRLKPWYFLLLAIISAAICVLSLRANNQHMIKLRDAVYTADKNATDIQKPLQDLQTYVTSHMNTDLSAGKTPVYPPIQLKYTYERLLQAQQDAFAKSNNQLYTDAQHYCEGQNSADFSGRNRVPCIEQYVQSHSSVALPTIPDALYKFSFVSPRWSPDLAGISLALTLLFGLLFAVTFISQRLKRYWSK